LWKSNKTGIVFKGAIMKILCKDRHYRWFEYIGGGTLECKSCKWRASTFYYSYHLTKEDNKLKNHTCKQRLKELRK
jgi:hypothetical protein